jgi:hypothetical protein
MGIYAKKIICPLNYPMGLFPSIYGKFILSYDFFFDFKIIQKNKG